MRFLSALMPRETRFFTLFDRHAEFVLVGGQAMAELVRDYADQARRAALIERINEVERSADKVTYETVSLLHATFITPFDRNDIHRLISGMDDILDLIQDAAESMHLFDIQTLPPATDKMATLLENCCVRVQAAVKLLKSMDNASRALAPGILKTAAFIFVSPLLGLTLGALLMIGVSWACLRAAPRKVDRWFRRLQLASSAMYSIGHGSNDAQKTMGQKITKLRPVGGFAAETGGAITLFLASSLGIPVSTTHTITGAIVGVGAAQRTRAVRWGVAGNIVVAWIVTMPAAALMAAAAYWLGTTML
jgi:uncharacterized protein Yka (UPF0111/DUF47 family)